MLVFGSFDFIVIDEFIFIIMLSSDDLGGGSGGVQNIFGVLFFFCDVFVFVVVFIFGLVCFNIRGYDVKYIFVLVNGMLVNDLEIGWVFWNYWGGLNDVFCNCINIIGLGVFIFVYGGVGGVLIIDMCVIF